MASLLVATSVPRKRAKEADRKRLENQDGAVRINAKNDQRIATEFVKRGTAIGRVNCGCFRRHRINWIAAARPTASATIARGAFYYLGRRSIRPACPGEYFFKALASSCSDNIVYNDVFHHDRVARDLRGQQHRAKDGASCRRLGCGSAGGGGRDGRRAGGRGNHCSQQEENYRKRNELRISAVSPLLPASSGLLISRLYEVPSIRMLTPFLFPGG